MAQDQIVNTVFKRTDNSGTDKFTKGNVHAFNILMAIDGKRSVGKIAQDDAYEIQDLVGMVQQMLDQGLIEPAVSGGADMLREGFFEKLESILGQMMGPVGGILMQEKVSELGHAKANFPMSKAHELIDMLCQAIPDAGQAQTFRRIMADKLSGKM